MGKPGILTMFLGSVLIAILLLVDIEMSFTVWVTCFLISMLIAAVGAIMSIIELSKKIKAEKNNS